MRTKLFDRDASLGMTQYFHYDDDKDEFTIETRQDVSSLVELNKAKFNQTDEKARWGELSQVASIPLNIYYDLKKRGILDDKKKLRAWLNDPDNRAFRTRPGQV
jgi:hypothetical protein